MIGRAALHWPLYLMEAAELLAFMVSACLVTAAVEHPASPLRARLPSAALRRLLIGLAMGLTAVALIYSPLGQASGAHMNPAVTAAMLVLGRMGGVDALFYLFAQAAGGVLGVVLARALVPAVAHPAVACVVTVPGPRGRRAAFAGELAIAFLLMSAVLLMGRSKALAPWTGLVAGALLVLFITFEAPLSGMSMNPARTFGSAVVARRFDAFWIYVLAPLAAMLLAAFLHAATGGEPSGCPRLCPADGAPCALCEGDALAAADTPRR